MTDNVCGGTLKPCFSTHNRAWLLVGRPHSSRLVLPERRTVWCTTLVTVAAEWQQKSTGKILRFVRRLQHRCRQL